LFESVPPRRYGGTERVVAFLTEELVRRGHDVTLFASAESQTSARLIPAASRALRHQACSGDCLAPHVVLLEQVCRAARQFDVLHFHVDYLHFPLTRRMGWPSVTTLHGRLDLPELQAVYDEFGEMPVVSISEAQRRPLPQANWQATVHHGLPPDLFAFREAPGDYLAFLGRVSPEKRVDRAVEIARRVGLPLRVAAKIDRADRAYFESQIAPLFDLPFVRYLGEIGEAEKGAFLGGARALLFPIDWAEPFGLVVIEAMACGTPVIAWRGGSVEEVVAGGVSGFIVDSLEEAVEATRAVGRLSRRACRRYFESAFTTGRMAEAYLAVYEGLIGGPDLEEMDRLDAAGQVG
jgi:glycosyltransferase involved in cell wall biosynthesis